MPRGSLLNSIHTPGSGDRSLLSQHRNRQSKNIQLVAFTLNKIMLYLRNYAIYRKEKNYFPIPQHFRQHAELNVTLLRRKRGRERLYYNNIWEKFL